MAANSPRFIAGGNINPSVIVKQDPTNNFHVLQAAAAGDKPIGISQDASYNPPGVAGSDGYAAHANQPITVYGEGEECLLRVGASGVTAGDLLTSDVNGLAKTIAFTYTASTTIFQVAEALETANAGELCRVVVRIQALPGVSA